MVTAVEQTHRTSMIWTLYIVLAWGALALGGSLLGTFAQQSGMIALAAGGPVLLFLIVYLFSAAFRRFMNVLVGDAWGIIVLQTTRALGVVILVMMSRNALPAVFALPAGWGDVFIGVTAPLVALAWSSGSRFGRVVFVLWNVLGILDLITALTMGTLAGTVLQGPITMAPIALFPLSLIPTFATPIDLILHITGLGWLWQRK